jgi:hypothetical protein
VTDLLAPLLALPGVEPAVAGARSAIDGLLSHRVLRRGSAEVTAESALRGARASAELEGAGIELERLRGQLMAGTAVVLPGSSAGAGERGARLVQGAVRLHADLGQLLVAWRHSPRQALARLHVLAPPSWSTSPTRSAATERPVEPTTRWPGQGAPTPAEVAARPGRAGPGADHGTSAPAVVAAAVVHGELMALRPFGTADGLVARAGPLVLVDRGARPQGGSAPEVGHAELHREYGEALHAYVSAGRQACGLDRALRAGGGARCARGGAGRLRGDPARIGWTPYGRSYGEEPGGLGTAALRGGPPSPCVGAR